MYSPIFILKTKGEVYGQPAKNVRAFDSRDAAEDAAAMIRLAEPRREIEVEELALMRTGAALPIWIGFDRGKEVPASPQMAAFSVGEEA